MVLENVDPAVAAQQALHWYNAGENESTEGQTVDAGGAEQLDGEMDRARPSRGDAAVVPKSLEVGQKFYAFCSLSAEAAKRATKGGASAFDEVDGLLGRGVYCSVSEEVARSCGAAVVVLRCFPAGEEEDSGYRGLRCSLVPDPAGEWRSEGFAGCWQPLGLGQVQDPRGELCIRAATVTKATLHAPDSWLHSDRATEVRKTAWLLAGGIPRFWQRWSYQAKLVRWPSVGFALVAVIVGLFLARLGFYGSAAGAIAVSCVFAVSTV